MTLRTLAKETMVQGNVKIEMWEDSEPIEEYSFTYVDNLLVTLSSYPETKQLLKRRVKFMFCSGDGYLHIELE